MYGLLSWLWEQAVKVYHWFGSQYWSSVSVIINISSVISGWATWAYNAAVSYAINVINTTYNHLQAWVQAALNWVESKASQAYDLAVWAYNQIKTVYSTIVDYIADQIARVILSIRSWVVDQVNRLLSLLQSLKLWVDNYVSNLMGSWLLYKQRLIDLANFFTPDRLRLWVQQQQDQTRKVTLFFSNPLGFMLGYLLDIFIDILCYQLASALGTIKYSLPPRPAWSFTAPIHTGDTDLPDRVVEGGLSKPLEALSISGYTFNQQHPGIDLGLTSMEPVYAIHGGVVEVAGWSTVGYGNYVDILGTPMWSRYAHLADVLVQAGQPVQAGQIIGLGDSTGNSTGNHLHLEIKISGKYVDPVSLFNIMR